MTETDGPETVDQTKNHADDAKTDVPRTHQGQRHMVWVDMDNPDAAYAALMRLVDESATRTEHEHGGSVHRDESES